MEGICDLDTLGFVKMRINVGLTCWRGVCCETDLVEELIVVDNPKSNQCETLSDPKRFFMGLLSPSSYCKSRSMIASARLCWDSKTRVYGRKLVSDVALHQLVRPWL